MLLGVPDPVGGTDAERDTVGDAVDEAVTEAVVLGVGTNVALADGGTSVLHRSAPQHEALRWPSATSDARYSGAHMLTPCIAYTATVTLASAARRRAPAVELHGGPRGANWLEQSTSAEKQRTDAASVRSPSGAETLKAADVPTRQRPEKPDEMGATAGAARVLFGELHMSAEAQQYKSR